MSPLLQQLIVVLVVVAAAVFASWRLMPASMRLRWLDRLGNALGPVQSDGGGVLQRWIGRRRERLTGSGCAGCSGKAPPKL
jgi:hypothetical protein